MRVNFALICFFFTVITCSVSAQTSKTKQKPAAQKQKTVRKDEEVKKEEIPPVERLEDTRIDVSDTTNHANYIPINFDTTSAPNDPLTSDIKKLMDVIDFKKNLFTTMTKALDQNSGQIPAEYREKFKMKFLDEFDHGNAARWLENIFVRAYRDNFTQEEIKQLIQFYQTDLGKKFVAKTPGLTLQIMSDSQQLGSYVGMKVAQEIFIQK